MNQGMNGASSFALAAEEREHTVRVRMHAALARLILAFFFASQLLAQAASVGSDLRRVHEIDDPSRATLRVHAAERAAQAIPRFITGKFAEHLGANIYNGMDAQILRNPTFADYPFWTGQMTPDGLTKFHVDESQITQELRRQALRYGWPESELNGLVAARADSLACFWTRQGPRDAVQASPDTGTAGGRAQRVQVRAAGQGLAQWVYLPLHRARRYEFEILARSPDITSLTVGLTAFGDPALTRPSATLSHPMGKGVRAAAVGPREFGPGGHGSTQAQTISADVGVGPSSERRAGDSVASPSRTAPVVVRGLSAAWKTFKEHWSCPQTRRERRPTNSRWWRTRPDRL
jgi:hypothetical protein